MNIKEIEKILPITVNCLLTELWENQMLRSAFHTSDSIYDQIREGYVLFHKGGSVGEEIFKLKTLNLPIGTVSPYGCEGYHKLVFNEEFGELIKACSLL